jgi:ParB family chromosome partitioning protein
LRDTRDLRHAHAQVRASLEAAGIAVVEQARWYQEVANLTDDHGDPLTEDTHKECPGHAATPQQQWSLDGDGDGDGDGGYRTVVRTIWVCTDPQDHDHHGRFRGAPHPAAGRVKGQETPRLRPSRPGPTAGK